MNILVTGANGQLGNELRNISGSYPAYRFFFTDVAELDITNRGAVDDFMDANAIGLVINCAAYTAVDKAETDQPAADLLNIEAVGHLAAACKRTSAALIHISTDYVFSGNACNPYDEANHTDPESVYGHSKMLGEQAALICPNSVVIRTSWLYSPFGNNFVKTMLRLGKERDTVNVVFDQVGTPTYAADLAQTIMVVAERAEQNTLVTGIFHYTNEGVCSWYDFAHEIMQQAGLRCIVKPIETKDYPTPARRPRYSVLNKARIKAAYGIEIPHWKDSLLRCLHEVLNNR
jgi:dTDP-4-dehydrorhamnose reductase